MKNLLKSQSTLFLKKNYLEDYNKLKKAINTYLDFEKSTPNMIINPVDRIEVKLNILKRLMVKGFNKLILSIDFVKWQTKFTAFDRKMAIFLKSLVNRQKSLLNMLTFEIK